MKLVNYFFGAALFAFFLAPTCTHAKNLPELQEMQDSKFQRKNNNLHSEQLIESFYRRLAPKEILLDGVFNVATRKPIVEKVYPSVKTSLPGPYFEFTETIDTGIDTVKVPYLIGSLIQAALEAPETLETPEMLEINKRVDEKLRKYKGRQVHEEDQEKRSALIIEIKNICDQFERKLIVQNRKKYRTPTPELTDVFIPPLAPYDVVLKRNHRSSITPSIYYMDSQEVMPLEMRKRAPRSEEWNEVSNPQGGKRKWVERSDAWDEMTRLSTNKKRRLNSSPS
jgi:hypothetical protein